VARAERTASKIWYTIKNVSPMPQTGPRNSALPWSVLARHAINNPKMARCANPFAYWPVYTAPTPKGKTPARIPATVGFGPVPLGKGTPAGGGGITPGVGIGPGIVAPVPGTNVDAGPVPAMRAPRQSSQ